MIILRYLLRPILKKAFLLGFSTASEGDNVEYGADYQRINENFNHWVRTGNIIYGGEEMITEKEAITYIEKKDIARNNWATQNARPVHNTL